MNPSIIEKLESLHVRCTEIQALLTNTDIISDQVRLRELSLEYARLSNISHYLISWQQIQKDISDMQQIIVDDPEMYEIVQEELKNAKMHAKEIEQRLKIMLLPKDEDDKKNVFLEIRAGTGGEEAALFASDLFRMYSRYSEAYHWKIDILNIHEGEYGGYKEIIAKISGQGVYSRLKFESGGHRVQRIPSTESQGRIHTSSCTVAVIPEIPEKELPHINPTDIRINTFRSSGAGGQHVNTTNSAIRITHLPTNIVVECQNERSQHQNKAKALAVLAARIRTKEIEKRQQAQSLMRRNLLGSGDRNDRKRTYNFPQGRITDHRINLTLYCLDKIIAGELDRIINPIIQEYQADLLSTILVE